VSLSDGFIHSLTCQAHPSHAVPVVLGGQQQELDGVHEGAERAGGAGAAV
jgi:hypothetical protein